MFFLFGRYEHLDLAFLYEFTVGLLALYCVFAAGPVGMTAWAILGLRPQVLKFRPGPVDERVRQLYFEDFKWSVLLTGATLLITYLMFDFLPVSYHDRIIILFTTVPWLTIIHGLVGYILTWENRQVLEKLN